MSQNESTVDDATEERRLFSEQLRTRTAFAACDLGIARVSLAGGRVGHAGLVERCTATSIATDDERIVAGTVRGVLVGEGDGFGRLGEAFEVAAVGLTPEGHVLAAGDDGHVLAWDSDHGWESLGTVSEPHRFDGALLAAGDGLYRVTGDLEPLGLSTVHDVADGEETFAATDDGIYRQGADGWQREHDRPTAAVVTAGGDAHAIDDQGVLERVERTWEQSDAPALPVDLTYAGTLCGITADGTVLVSEREGVDGDDGWRSHPLGLRGVVEFDVQ